jgi:hypothetical protein
MGEIYPYPYCSTPLVVILDQLAIYFSPYLSLHPHDSHPISFPVIKVASELASEPQNPGPFWNRPQN